MRFTYYFLLVLLSTSVWAQTPATSAEIETVFPDARALYLDLHQNPELSSHETQTATKLAGRLPGMASEDFSYFTAQGVRSFYFSLGGADPAKYAEAKAAGVNLPSNHSPLFAPDVDPSLRTGIAAEVAVLRNLLN